MGKNFDDSEFLRNFVEKEKIYQLYLYFSDSIYNHGFKKHDVALIESIISENEEIIIERWKEYFNQK